MRRMNEPNLGDISNNESAIFLKELIEKYEDHLDNFPFRTSIHIEMFLIYFEDGCFKE